MVYDRSLTNRGQQTSCLSRVEFFNFPADRACDYYLSPFNAPSFYNSHEKAVDMGYFYLKFTQIYLLERPKVRSLKCTRRMVP